MRVLVQRTLNASVTVDGETVGEIPAGLCLFVGITQEDTEKEVTYLVQKIVNLRIFEDDEDKMNLSLKDAGGSVLSISQFTLYADAKKGCRPNFMKAASGDFAEHLYKLFNQRLEAEGIEVATGIFGTFMDVTLTNHGPTTIWLDTAELM